MNVGTKSLLFGVHQFKIHPVTVLLAWHELYGWPNWKETICILIHDWGYWGCRDMDGEEGKKHPECAAKWAHRHLDKKRRRQMPRYEYHDLCLYHSRHCAKNHNTEPSKLCWADKLSCKYDPWWLYLPRAVLSGEIYEYRQAAADFGAVPLSASHLEWYRWAQARMVRKAYNRDTRTSYEAGS